MMASPASETDRIEREEAQKPEILHRQAKTTDKPSERGLEDGLASLLGKRFKLGGELEFEYVDTQDDQILRPPPLE